MDIATTTDRARRLLAQKVTDDGFSVCQALGGTDSGFWVHQTLRGGLSSLQPALVNRVFQEMLFLQVSCLFQPNPNCSFLLQ